MADKTWKARERKVASYFNTNRTPLSGGSSRHTRSDSLHDKLFVECKLRKRHSVVSLLDETNEMAKQESKTPVIALCESGRPGFWVMVHSDDLEKVAETIKKK